MNFSATGDTYILIVTCATFAGGLSLGPLSLSQRLRKWLLLAGPVGWIVWLLFASPAGEDGLAWALIGAFGVVTWTVGLAVGYLVHEMRDPTAAASLGSRLRRLVTLR
jgi:hypothetical protein